MNQAINRGAPTVGGAIGYFLITMYAVPEGMLAEQYVAEGVVFAGIIVTNILMELKAFCLWIGSLFKKKG
jgi:hypothetical protein